MKKLALAILLFIGIQSVFAQPTGKRLTRYGFEINQRPRIYYDVYPTYNEAWQARIAFLLRVQNDLLQYKKDQDVYKAGFEVSFTLWDEVSENVVFTEIWKESISEAEFNRTNSKQIFQKTHRYLGSDISPGKYMVLLEVTDRETGNVFKSSRGLEIPPAPEKSLRNSGLHFIDPVDSLSAEIVLANSIYTLDFNRNYIARVDILSDSSKPLSIDAKLTKIEGEGLPDSLIMMDSYELPAAKFQTFTQLLIRNLFQEGSYSLQYTVRQGNETMTIKKPFRIVWYDKPVYLYKYDLAIRPLQYVLSESEWNRIDDLSYEEQEKWFHSYWKEKDPTAETPINEILYEFYHRVQMSNQKFSTRFREGWETDRGKATILYGDPDRKETSRYNTSTKPFEIWFYTELNQKLTFVDVNRDDNYKLVSVEEFKDKE